MQKILYQLGFDPELVGPWKRTVDQLLRRRNDVAHGSAKGGLENRDYEQLDKAVNEVIDAMVAAITNALLERTYLAAPGKHGLATADEDPPPAAGSPRAGWRV